jgi:hypothetical protein
MKHLLTFELPGSPLIAPRTSSAAEPVYIRCNEIILLLYPPLDLVLSWRNSLTTKGGNLYQPNKLSALDLDSERRP